VKKIGLLSDTHGYLDEAIFTHFEKCDEIWHAGDFGNLELAEALSDFKPLRGVYGNIDGQDIRQLYPETLRFSIEELDVFMIHIGGYPDRYSPVVKDLMLHNPPSLFISGHSHILKVIYDKKFECLHLNPGAAGKQGWHKVRTLQRFDIEEGKIQNLEVIELATRH
jgi:putative phosphoesterase